MAMHPAEADSFVANRETEQQIKDYTEKGMWNESRTFLKTQSNYGYIGNCTKLNC